MKRILALVTALLIATPAWACDHFTRAYGTQTTLDFCLYVTDATVGAVKVESAAHASGDTYLMKDEAAEANTTNGFTDEGSCYSIVLTATEMQAARILVNIEDQGTKTWADKCLVVETYGNASAQFGVSADVNVVSMAADTVTASAIAADAIGASELAASAIGTSEFAAEADVNAEVLDVMNVDTFGELTSCPTATASFKTMIQYLFMAGRNKWTQTSTTGTLFRDDGSTGLCTFTDSDAAGTTTRGEGG